MVDFSRTVTLDPDPVISILPAHASTSPKVVEWRRHTAPLERFSSFAARKNGRDGITSRRPEASSFLPAVVLANFTRRSCC